MNTIWLVVSPDGQDEPAEAYVRRVDALASVEGSREGALIQELRLVFPAEAEDRRWKAYQQTIITDSFGVRWTGHGAVEELPGDPIYGVTAHNPNGVPLSAMENEDRQATMLREVADHGWTYWPVVGSSQDGLLSEESVALCGLGEEQALALARKWEQIALFLLTNDDLMVISCADGQPVSRRPRRS
ncbi:MAG: DUF3293 domain-containing protein [Rhodothermales bacterium]|nr:DUF3293 domain-containing protein [Rhodothermales bacterium]MBO6778694.1 DUF3293 domain-containing protein [Rhodothermales bacterium]